MSDETFPLVDEDGRVIGSAKRTDAHGDPSLLHPVVHCLVVDSRDRLLLQLRSKNKDIQPGKWDTSVGGHVALGESVEAAVERELSEEIGVDARSHPLEFLYRYLMRNDIESELVHTYRCRCGGPFVRPEGEIEELRFWNPAEIDAAIGTGLLTPNFEDEYRRFRARSRDHGG